MDLTETTSLLKKKIIQFPLAIIGVLICLGQIDANWSGYEFHNAAMLGWFIALIYFLIWVFKILFIKK